MTRTTLYTVRAFRDEDGDLVAEEPTQFTTAGPAQAHSQSLAQTRAGVVVWARSGDPDTGQWDDPRIVFRAGRFGEEF